MSWEEERLRLRVAVVLLVAGAIRNLYLSIKAGL